MGKYYYLCFGKSKRDHSKWMQFKKIDIKANALNFPRKCAASRLSHRQGHAQAIRMRRQLLLWAPFIIF